MTEAHFIPHCDDGSCDLGSFYYCRPTTNKWINDYAVWWRQDELYKNNIEFRCTSCNLIHVVTYNQEECEYNIKL